MNQVLKGIMVVALVAVGIGYGVMQGMEGNAIKKANHLKDEGNAANAAGQKLLNDIDAKYQSLFTDEALKAFPTNRAQHASAAKETTEACTKAIEQFRLAAAKFDEASKQKIDQTVADYFSGWSQVASKSADRCEVFRNFALIWSDDAVSTQEKLDARLEELKAKREGLDKEISDLEANAAKIQADNSSKFD
jgi:hypothetical protein